MARCLRPLTIRRPGFADAPHSLPRYGRENLRPYLFDDIVVPCGKCLACLKNKQSSMVVRCKREAEKRGTFAFMTLTYDDDHLPLARSLFRVDTRTGEEQVVVAPEFVSTGFHPDASYCDAFKSMQASECPRCVTCDWFSDGSYLYQIRVTPSVCRLDVRTWLKECRILYKREFGEPMPEFSYTAISEYGPRTCRPHYHLAFFGLQKRHLDWMLDKWRFGKVKQVKMVMHVNQDGSNGFARASAYIGKYMSKGKFECSSVSEGLAERPRVCQSKNLGAADLEPVRRQVLCFDMFGEYDPDTLRLKDGRELSRLQVDALVNEIPNRLTYMVCPESRTADGIVTQKEIRLPLPRIIRDKIFKYNDRYTDKTKKVSSTLWLMVTAHIRDVSSRDRSQQFEQFLAGFGEGALSQACTAFAYLETLSADAQEASMQKGFVDFYSKSFL